MKRLTTTAALIALTAGTAAYADNHNMDAAKDNADAAMQNAEQAMENTGDAIENETNEAVAEGEQAMEEAGDAMAEAGDEMKQEASEMGNEMAQAVDGPFGADSDGLIRTRDITGGTVYAIDADGEATDWDESMSYDAVSEEWDNVGEIEDIVLNADGSFRGIVAEVGGFLDIGDKHVLLEIDNAKFVPIDDGSYSVVTNMTSEELESLEDIDEGPMN